MTKKLPTPKITEKDVTREVRTFLNLNHIFHFKHWGGPMSPKGVSDILGCCHGRFLAIELKWPDFNYNHKPTKTILAQKEFIRKVQSAGGIAFFARSLDEVIENLLKEGIKLRWQPKLF